MSFGRSSKRTTPSTSCARRTRTSTSSTHNLAKLISLSSRFTRRTSCRVAFVLWVIRKEEGFRRLAMCWNTKTKADVRCCTVTSSGVTPQCASDMFLLRLWSLPRWSAFGFIRSLDDASVIAPLKNQRRCGPCRFPFCASAPGDTWSQREHGHHRVSERASLMDWIRELVEIGDTWVQVELLWLQPFIGRQT